MEYEFLELHRTKTTQGLYQLEQANTFYCGVFIFFRNVLKPNGKYSGHTLTRLVSIKTAANANNTIATVPEMTFV